MSSCTLFSPLPLHVLLTSGLVDEGKLQAPTFFLESKVRRSRALHIKVSCLNAAFRFALAAIHIIWVRRIQALGCALHEVEMCGEGRDPVDPRGLSTGEAWRNQV